MTDGFTFFPNYAEALEGFTDKQRLEFYDCLVEAGIYGREPQPKDKVVKAMIKLILPTLNKSVARMTAGKAGGSKQKSGKAESKTDDDSEDDKLLLDKQNEICLTSKNENDSEANSDLLDNLKNKNKYKYKNTYSKEKEKESLSLSLPTLSPESASRGDASADAAGESCGRCFGEFWDAYPKQESKAAAVNAWEAAWKKGGISPDTMPAILTAIDRKRKSRQWRQEDGRFIPLPATFIARREWEDEARTNVLSGISIDDSAAKAAGLVKESSFDTSAFFAAAVEASEAQMKALAGGDG
ncbi:MAG: hypothetical protein II767_13530 [Proteobacteria bacterium]|nr:hypothetical protein [Pseudomonadota bacterium]